MRVAVLLLISCLISFSQVGPVNPGGGGGGSATPGGAPGAVQYNLAGALGGNTAFLYENQTAIVPSAPTVTRLGTAGAETSSYVVVAHNLIGTSVQSAAGSVATSQLAGINNRVVTAAVTGSTYCDVYLTVAPAGGTTGMLTTPNAGIPCGSTYNDTSGIAGNPNPPPGNPDSTTGLAVAGTITATQTLRALQNLQIGTETISDTFCTNASFVSPFAPSECAPVSFALSPHAGLADSDWTFGEWNWATFPAETHNAIEVGLYSNAYHPSHGVSEAYDALFGAQISSSARNAGTVDDVRGFQAFGFAYNPSLTVHTIYGNTGYAEMDGGIADLITGAQGQAMAFNDGVTTSIEGGHFETWQLAGTITGKVIGVTAQITYDVGSSAAYELFLPSFASSNSYSAQWAIRQDGVGNPNYFAGPIEQIGQIFSAITLLTIPDGTSVYCSDCTVTSGIDDTCAGSGSGASVSRVNGVLRCRI